jgi:hypothetical protein
MVRYHTSIDAVAKRYKALDSEIRNGSFSVTDAIGHFAWVTKRGDELGIGSLGSYMPDSADDDAGSASFTITTPEEDRDGDIVMPMGCQLGSYSKNPVVFFGHQQSGWEIPIGVSKSPDGRLCVYPEANRMWATCYFDRDDPDADFIYGKVKRKILNATSIAFVPIEAHRRDEFHKAQTHRGSTVPLGWYFKQYELTEWSIVGVPANAGAIRDALDQDRKHLSRRMQKALRKYCAEPRGRCFTGWCPGGVCKRIKGGAGIADQLPRAIEAAHVSTAPEIKDEEDKAHTSVHGEHKSCSCKACSEHKPCPCAKGDGSVVPTTTDVAKSWWLATYTVSKGGKILTLNERLPAVDKTAAEAEYNKRFAGGKTANGLKTKLVSIEKDARVLNQAIRQAQDRGYNQVQDYSGEWKDLQRWIRTSKPGRGWDWATAEVMGDKLVATDEGGTRYTWTLRKSLVAKNTSQADIEPPMPRIEEKYIRHEHGQWVVHAHDGRVLGKHGSKGEAEAQLRAVEANKHKGLNEASGTAGGFTVPTETKTGEDAKKKKRGKQPMADTTKKPTLKRYVVKTPLGYIAKKGGITDDEDDAKPFSDEKEAETAAEHSGGEVKETGPFVPKPSAKTAAHLYRHYKNGGDWLHKALDQVDHPGMSEGLREHHEQHIVPAMDHLKGLVHQHHGEDGSDPDELMDQHLKALETDGNAGEPGQGEAFSVAQGNVPPESTGAPPPEEDVTQDTKAEPMGFDEEGSEEPPPEEDKGALQDWAAEEEEEMDHNRKGASTDVDTEAIMERYRTPKGWGTRKMKLADLAAGTYIIKRINGRLYAQKASDGKCPDCGAKMVGGKCPKCDGAKNGGGASVDSLEQPSNLAPLKAAGNYLAAMARDSSVPSRYSAPISYHATALQSRGAKDATDAHSLMQDLIADTSIPKYHKPPLRQLCKALTDAGKVQRNGGNGSPLTQEGKTQRNGGPGSALTDAGAKQANKPTGIHGEFIEGDPDKKEHERVDETVDNEFLKRFQALRDRFAHVTGMGVSNN